MADLTQLRTLREHHVATLAHLDQLIAEEEAKASLHGDQVAERKRENAFRLGRTLGNSVPYATPDTLEELRSFLAAELGSAPHLVEEAVRGARASWDAAAAEDRAAG